MITTRAPDGANNDRCAGAQDGSMVTRERTEEILHVFYPHTNWTKSNPSKQPFPSGCFDCGFSLYFVQILYVISIKSLPGWSQWHVGKAVRCTTSLTQQYRRYTSRSRLEQRDYKNLDLVSKKNEIIIHIFTIISKHLYCFFHIHI